MAKTFEHSITVTLGKTNAEGNVYWANFMIWFGEIRELFLMHLLPEVENVLDYMISNNWKIVTCQTEMSNLREVYFCDQLIATVNTEKISNASLWLSIYFQNIKTKEVVAEGKQKIAFTDFNGKIIRIPDTLKNAALEYDNSITN